MESGEGIESIGELVVLLHEVGRWNPVKELKGHSLRLFQPREREVVESGEGIERMKRSRSTLRALEGGWNPVKELKVKKPNSFSPSS